VRHKSRILIAGAGIGGLTAALALLKRGFDVRVYEQASELREPGAGVQIAANGSRPLIDLGLRDALTRVAVEPTGKEVRLWSTGQTWKLFDLGDDSIRRFGAPYWMLHRGDLQRVLVEAVLNERPDAIVLDAKAIGCVQNKQEAILELADGRSIPCEVLIGADGVHSAIRQALFGSEKPSFTGILAWRGLVPLHVLPSDVRRLVGTNWVGPGGHVVTYPVRGGELLNFVGMAERDDWRVESWTERGTTTECMHDFKGWHPIIHEIIRKIEVPFKWALLGREPLTSWSVGRISLLGDAAHPTLPFFAQGANMAIEDGVVLARCLEDSSDDVASALARFERARLQRTSAIVRGSADNTRRFHNPTLADPIAGAAYIEREWDACNVRTRYDWLFQYNASAIAI
jgi:salicylate hydroxylase